MVGHLLGPLAWTSLVSSASSLADHGALPDVGAARGGLFFAPPLDLLEEVGRVAVAALVGVAGALLAMTLAHALSSPPPTPACHWEGIRGCVPSNEQTASCRFSFGSGCEGL